MTDRMFYSSLKRLTAGTSPLLNVNGSNRWPTGDCPTTEVTLGITQTGRAVLGNGTDWIGRNGIDRWLGGVHLHGTESIWRWDGENRRLVGQSY